MYQHCADIFATRLRQRLMLRNEKVAFGGRSLMRVVQIPLITHQCRISCLLGTQFNQNISTNGQKSHQIHATEPNIQKTTFTLYTPLHCICTLHITYNNSKKNSAALRRRRMAGQTRSVCQHERVRTNVCRIFDTYTAS